MIYIARNYSYWPTFFAADSTGLCSLVLTQLCLTVEPSEYKVILGHSFCNQLNSITINYRATRGSISPYNIAGLISEVSEVATQIAKNCRRRQPHSHLRQKCTSFDLYHSSAQTCSIWRNVYTLSNNVLFVTFNVLLQTLARFCSDNIASLCDVIIYFTII